MGKRVAGREATDRARIDAIVAILKKSVFVDDQSAAIAALDALANATDSISLDKTSYLFNGVGGTMTLTAYTDPASKPVTWSSSNTSVATVSDGVVTAVAEGTATITATSGDKSVTCAITVQAFQVDSVTLNQSTLTSSGEVVGATHQLTATTSPVGGSIVWSSSNNSVATVDQTGLVTIVGNGSCTITATSGTESDTCALTVSGVVHQYHINVGTLSNVTIEDGNGNAITDGQVITEGSTLTLVLVPASSHEITTASVTMGNVAQTLTDGTGGTKTVTLTVAGDIAVSASALFVRTDLLDGVSVEDKMYLAQNTGVPAYNWNGAKGKIVEVDCGKRYIITGVKGCKFGYGLYKKVSDSYVLLDADDDVPAADLANYQSANAQLRSDGRLWVNLGPSGYYEATFDSITLKTPPSVNSGVGQLYICISVLDDSDETKIAGLSMYEWSVLAEDSFDPSSGSADWESCLQAGIAYNNGAIGGTNAAIIKLQRGVDYEFTNYNQNKVSINAAMGLVVSSDGGYTLERVPTISGYPFIYVANVARPDVTTQVGGNPVDRTYAAYMNSDYNTTNYKYNYPDGEFTAPSTQQLSSVNIDANADLYLIVNADYIGSDFTFGIKTNE